MRRLLFVTGTARSGTTLVDKLLSLHPSVEVLSQPMPLVYVELKRAFLRSLGSATHSAESYPLNDMFVSHAYRPGDLVDFLRAQRLERSFLRRVFDDMRDYDGQLTRPSHLPRLLSEYTPTELFDVVERYLVLECAEEATVVGTKEVFCEEYIPYYLDRGGIVVLVVRDPRDVLTSLNFGTAAQRYSGRPKPDLFNVRQWRKSVAFTLQYMEHPRCSIIRYEQLIADPGGEIGRVFESLELDPLASMVARRGVVSAAGKPWLSNSSHEPVTFISDASIGRYREFLDESTVHFVEALCLPEMRALGYSVDLDAEQVGTLVADRVPDATAARGALRMFRWNEERRDEELARWRALREGRFEAPLFAFERAFERLSAALVT